MSIFDQNFDFLPKISIFCPKLRFLTKISIFDQNFDFSLKFVFVDKISIFDKNFYFWLKFRFLTKNETYILGSPAPAATSDPFGAPTFGQPAAPAQAAPPGIV